MRVSEQMVDSALRALVKLRDALMDAVREAGPDGIPECYLHIALLELRAPPSLPRRIIDALVEGGVLRRQHDRIYLAEVSAPQNASA